MASIKQMLLTHLLQDFIHDTDVTNYPFMGQEKAVLNSLSSSVHLRRGHSIQC